MLFTNYLLRSHFGANAEVGAYSALGLHQAGRPADGLSVVLAGPLIFLELVRHRKRCVPIVFSVISISIDFQWFSLVLWIFIDFNDFH